MVLAGAGDATRGIMVLVGFLVGLALRFGSLRFNWTAWVPR